MQLAATLPYFGGRVEFTMLCKPPKFLVLHLRCGNATFVNYSWSLFASAVPLCR